METSDTDPMQGAGAESGYLVGINLTTSALETLMEACTVNNLPPAAPHDDAVRCLLAIELSKKSWIVAVNTPLSDKISRYTLESCDWKGLLDLCERIRTRVAREMKKPVEIISCYEAGYDGFWLHRLLEAHGIRNYVMIRQAYRLIVGRAEPRRTESMSSECSDHCWRICGVSRRFGALCACPVSPKRTTVGSIVSVAD